jgi:integrase
VLLLTPTFDKTLMKSIWRREGDSNPRIATLLQQCSFPNEFTMLNNGERLCLHTIYTQSILVLMAWLFMRHGSKYWWVGHRLNSRQFRYSTKTKIRADAEKEMAKVNSMVQAQAAGMLTREVYHALTKTNSERTSIKAAVANWLKESKGSTSEGTHERYSDVGKAFLEFLKAGDDSPTLQDITHAIAQRFLDSVRAARSVGTANLYRRVLSGFFIRAVKSQIIPSNPIYAVPHYKASRREAVQRRAYTLDEVKTMHGKAPDDFWRYMILGGFFTGLRMGDLICLTWANIDRAANMLRLTDAKTGKHLKIPIASNLRQLLDELRTKAGKVKESDFIWLKQSAQYLSEGAGGFSNEFYDEVLLPAGLVEKRTKKKKKDGKGRGGARIITKVSFHSLRHTFVSLLRITGANQSTAKELAGHSSDEVNQLYTHTPEAVLVEAVSKLPSVTKS